MHTSPSPRRRAAAVVVAALVAVGAVGVVPGLVAPAAAASAKVTICHRTHSVTNPYRRISVSGHAVTRNNGHKGHNAAVFDPGFAYRPTPRTGATSFPAAMPTACRTTAPTTWP